MSRAAHLFSTKLLTMAPLSIITHVINTLNSVYIYYHYYYLETKIVFFDKKRNKALLCPEIYNIYTNVGINKW